MSDEIDELRRFSAPEPGGRERLALARARHDLLEHIAQVEPRSGRHFGWKHGVIAAAAAVLAVTFGFVQGGLGPPAANAEVRATLFAAASYSQRLAETPTPPGSYRHYRLSQVSWSGIYDSQRELVRDASGRTVRWKESREYEVWIPANQADEWVVRETTKASDLGSPRAVGLIQPDASHTWRAAGGRFSAHWEYRRTAGFDRYPREADELLAYVLENAPGEQPLHERAFDEISDLLLEPAAPEDLRPALLRALALVEGAYLAKDTPLLDGRPTVGVGLGDRDLLLFDASTDALVGVRSIGLFPGTGEPEMLVHIGESVTSHAPLNSALPVD